MFFCAACGEEKSPGVPLPDRVDAEGGYTFVLIRPGTFTMGSPDDDALRDVDERAHTARVEEPYYLQTHEVTQAQYEAVMGTNPSRFEGPELPVDSVSWEAARTFAERLSARDGVIYRLPTEVEWEYACRAGTTTRYHVGDSLTAVEANVRDHHQPTAGSGLKRHDARSTVAVGSYPPNAWGIHDLHGNVWEWVADPYAPYPGKSSVQPGASGKQVLRGGAWNFAPEAARCATRLALDGDKSFDCNGFRLVREALSGL